MPAALGNLANLNGLYLANNPLSGCIRVGLRGVQYDDLDRLGLPNC